MSKTWLLGALAAGAALSWACSSDKHGSAPAAAGSGGIHHAGGSDAAGGAADAAAAGQESGGAKNGGAGDSNTAGDGSSLAGSADGGGGAASTAGSSAVGGAPPDPLPPVGDEPLCPHQATPGTAALVALSGAGDDVLQAVTPDELTIAWKNGAHFYVAERASSADPFGTPSEVTGSEKFSAVTLRSDGLQLLAVTKDVSVVEMYRDPGTAFSDAAPQAGSFEAFNATLGSIPIAGVELSDPILSADGASFIFSNFYAGQDGSHATVQESRRSGGVWNFSSADLGAVLSATGAKRRVPTGLSADSLTLFYRDDVKGDFRAAWRVNTEVEFGYAETLSLGAGVQAAAPNGSCNKLYFSAQGQSDLDLFVTDFTK